MTAKMKPVTQTLSRARGRVGGGAGQSGGHQKEQHKGQPGLHRAPLRGAGGAREGAALPLGPFHHPARLPSHLEVNKENDNYTKGIGKCLY